MKYVYLLSLALAVSLLAANPAYYPTTTIAEDFGATWCDGCSIAWEGLQVLDNYTHNGELVTARLYTESGDLSSPTIQERFNYYEIIGIPAVVFNGKIRIDGSNDGIGDGTLYGAALKQFRYTASAVKMNIVSFSATAGTLNGEIEMVSPTANITNAKVVYYLLEDNVGEETNVVRSILYDSDIALTGTGSTYTFNKTFILNPTWNTSNLWAIAALQLDNKAIIQTASTLPLPTYNFRAAMDWNPSVEGQANVSYTSQPLWFFNLGAADNYTMRIVVDQAPDDWYFNYCDEEGNCYPGNMDRPFSLGFRENKSFHLNLWIGSPGFAYYRFVVSSPNIGEYSIPFHYKVEGVANEDAALAPLATGITGLYPNPVVNAADFTLQSDKSSAEATIDVFNVKGQKVQSLNARNLNQGENRISFIPDSSLPNGIYFYRLNGGTTKAGKFILMK